MNGNLRLGRITIQRKGGDRREDGPGIHVNWAGGSEVVYLPIAMPTYVHTRVFIYCSIGLACFMNF